jgi:hypothetical protein
MLGDDPDYAIGEGPHLTRRVFRSGNLGSEALQWLQARNESILEAC